jgi:hypothetical protein
MRGGCGWEYVDGACRGLGLGRDFGKGLEWAALIAPVTVLVT